MASSRARYSPESVESLVETLDRLRVTNPRAVNFNDHVLPGSTAANESEGGAASAPESIRSWKMAEHLYRRKDCPFPTLARGLFVQNVPLEGGRTRPRIAARGYDKFFNVGEVDWTEWSHLERNSTGPYHLTYKSNGCLILISALSPDELLVTSKHSLGTTLVPKEALAHAESSKQAQEREQGGEDTATKGQNKRVTRRTEEAANDSDPGRVATAPDSNQECSSTSNGQSKKQQKAEARRAQKQAEKEARAAGDEELARLQAEARQQREGAQAEEVVPHAEMGRRWVRETLQRAGKSEAELARVLWEQQYTAVTELCDDSFEEHVLPTPEHLTGLHLHGLNLNTPHFATLDPGEVEAFARAWGFIPTPSVQLASVDGVRAYTARVAQQGTWNGEAIEGFVVRCRVKDSAAAAPGARPDGEPPYPPGSPFFFKVKFEEPYLMYRQWREVSRALLPLLRPECKGRIDRKAFPWTQLGAKLKRAESAVYADWCARAMIDDPALFDNYDKGVVRVRERFLEWTRGEGREAWEAARAGKPAQEPSASKPAKIKTMIIPVAVPGCGKTLLGLALSKLYGFAHTQSDDVTTKRTAAGFMLNITNALKTSDVVYCDRNNHLPKHHEELAALAHSLSNDTLTVRTLALVWDVDSIPFNRALRIASERVLARGDAHQSLRPDPGDALRHEAVIKQFLNEFAPPEGGLLGRVVKLGVERAVGENLRTVIGVLGEELGVSPPTDEAVDAVLRETAGYVPKIKKELQGRPTPAIRYYGLSLEVDLVEMVERVLRQAPEGEAAGAALALASAQLFLQHLVAGSRVTAKPHITIVHEANVAEEAARGQGEGGDGAGGGAAFRPATQLWNTCAALRHGAAPLRFDFCLSALLWDARVMAFVVDQVRPHGRDGHVGRTTTATTGDADADDAALETALCSKLVSVLHVTVGTASAEIAPFEARGLVERWRGQPGPGAQEPGGHGVQCILLAGLRGTGRVLGMY